MHELLQCDGQGKRGRLNFCSKLVLIPNKIIFLSFPIFYYAAHTSYAQQQISMLVDPLHLEDLIENKHNHVVIK